MTSHQPIDELRQSLLRSGDSPGGHIFRIVLRNLDHVGRAGEWRPTAVGAKVRAAGTANNVVRTEPVVGGMSLTVGDFRPLWKAGLGFKIQGYGDYAGYNRTTSTTKEAEK